jgi:hypothetical protein
VLVTTHCACHMLMYWPQRATVASKNEALAASSKREQALQTKLTAACAEAGRKEASQTAEILDLETRLRAATADLDRQVRACATMCTAVRDSQPPAVFHTGNWV